tara:strand:+ start:835 stop:1236 length:402 start_codon:yes stop_codon:yes gene_type:complete
MIALSVLQLVNFYRARSLSCLGTFGVAYYLGCMYTKNKALCLLFAMLVATVIMGCEGRFVNFMEGMENSTCADHSSDEQACNSDDSCVYEAADATASPPTDAVCRDKTCSDHADENSCASPCRWESDACLDPL